MNSVDRATDSSSPPATWRAWLLLSPLLLWLAFFVIAPMAILIVYSFCQRDEFGDIVYAFTWENFSRAFESRFLMILIRSTWYAGLSTAICAVVGFPVAYFIGRSDGAGVEPRASLAGQLSSSSE